MVVVTTVVPTVIKILFSMVVPEPCTRFLYRFQVDLERDPSSSISVCSRGGDSENLMRF